MADDALPAPDFVSILEKHYLELGLGPKQARNLALWNADKPLARYLGNAKPILDKLAEGKRLLDVAGEIGVSKAALCAWLLEHEPEAWRAISAGNALARLDKVEDDLEAAETMVQVSKAREYSRNAQWQLERLARKHYSQRPEESAGGVTINVTVDRSLGGSVGITVDQDKP